MHADPLMHAEQVDIAEEARHAALAGEIEQAAERVRRSLQPLDIESDVLDVTPEVLAMVHEGRFDDFGKECARQLAAYCVQCARIEVGVEPAPRVPAFDRIVGRDEWAGHMDRMSAIAMSKEGAR